MSDPEELEFEADYERATDAAMASWPQVSGSENIVSITVGGEAFVRVDHDAYAMGYSAAMDDGWGEPGHINKAVADEKQRIFRAIRNYYAVAPKAAEPLLEFIEREGRDDPDAA